MKIKPADILYCGVDEEKIKNANPELDDEVLGWHNNYIFERHRIYKRKEIEKLPRPWTDDEIFQKYRFTNVRRELDRESVWLIENISKHPEMSLEEKLLYTILFRVWNKSETFEKLHLPHSLSILDFGEDEIDEMRKLVERLSKEDPKYVWFTSAFIMGGTKQSWGFPKNLELGSDRYDIPSTRERKYKVVNKKGKVVKITSLKEAREMTKNSSELIIEGRENCMPIRMIWLVKYARDVAKVHERVLKAKSQKEVFDILMEVPGLSAFLAYQIFVDFTYIEEFPFSENEFTVSGPGCNRGLNFLFKDRDGLSDEELLFWCRDNLPKIWEESGLETDLNTLFDHLPEYDRCLNVMMLENSFCELSKYTKAKRGLGRPRNNYKPTDKPMANQDQNAVAKSCKAILEEF
jgi:hypothetical protein